MPLSARSNRTVHIVSLTPPPNFPPGPQAPEQPVPKLPPSPPDPHPRSAPEAAAKPRPPAANTACIFPARLRQNDNGEAATKYASNSAPLSRCAPAGSARIAIAWSRASTKSSYTSRFITNCPRPVPFVTRRRIESASRLHTNAGSNHHLAPAHLIIIHIPLRPPTISSPMKPHPKPHHRQDTNHRKRRHVPPQNKPSARKLHTRHSKTAKTEAQENKTPSNHLQPSQQRPQTERHLERAHPNYLPTSLLETAASVSSKSAGNSTILALACAPKARTASACIFLMSKLIADSPLSLIAAATVCTA